MCPATESQSELSLQASAAAGIALLAVALGAPLAVFKVSQGNFSAAAVVFASTALLSLHALALRKAPRIARLTSLLVVLAYLGFLTTAFQTRGETGLVWAFPAVLCLYCLVEQRVAWITNGALIATFIPIAYLTLEFDLMLRAATTLIAVSALSAVVLYVLHRHCEMLIERMETDPLTGLLNRHSLHATLQLARKKTTTMGGHATLMALDVDKFKQINDSGGHAMGDIALRELGKSLKYWTRQEDDVFRTGGDEFLVVLYGVNSEEAFVPAEALRQAVQKDASSAAGLALTLSGGIASMTPNWSVDECVQAADDALYKAKSAGRDRLVLTLPAQEQDVDTAASTTSKQLANCESALHVL